MTADPAGRQELRALFEDASAGLSPGDREVIELQLRQGLATGEVATVLGVSRGRAHAVLTLAREQLEACLGVLLVGRAGRDDCGELGALLAGWDGRLTLRLRHRVQRHIERCPVCGARRALELRPARLRDLTPGAALAAGAAESFQLAFGPPPGLRAATIALATGHGAGARAHSVAVLARAGTFGERGFPEQERATAAGLHGQDAATGGSPGGPPGGRRGVRPGHAAAAVALLLAIIVAAIALILASEAEPGRPASPGPLTSLPGQVRPVRPRPTPTAPAPGPRSWRVAPGRRAAAGPGAAAGRRAVAEARATRGHGPHSGA